MTTPTPAVPALASSQPLPLSRNAFGRLELRLPDDGNATVTPVRAFPLAAPNEGVSLVGENGKEVLWIAYLDKVDAAARQLLDEDLAVREFSPIIERIVSVSTFSVPSVWALETDRGPVSMTLKAEEDIRKLASRQNLLIAATNGVQYRIPDTTRLDKQSRKFLERFL